MVKRSPRRSRAQKGFTLIELIIVVAIIGILVTVAMPVYKNAVIKAREAVLKENLYLMRDSIDQYFTDKGNFPADLNALVEEKYIKQIPVDPITGVQDTWIEEQAEADESNPDAPAGIDNVRSGAPGTGLDGQPYSEF